MCRNRLSLAGAGHGSVVIVMRGSGDGPGIDHQSYFIAGVFHKQFGGQFPTLYLLITAVGDAPTGLLMRLLAALVVLRSLRGAAWQRQAPHPVAQAVHRQRRTDDLRDQTLGIGGRPAAAVGHGERHFAIVAFQLRRALPERSAEQQVEAAVVLAPAQRYVPAFARALHAEAAFDREMRKFDKLWLPRLPALLGGGRDTGRAHRAAAVEPGDNDQQPNAGRAGAGQTEPKLHD